MAMDLILQAASKQDLLEWAKDLNLVEQKGDGVSLKRGLEFAPWAGSGKFMTARGEYGEEGEQITKAEFAPGFFGILRIGGGARNEDRIPGGGPEQWDRGKLARFIRNRGSQGSIAGITYYEVNGVRLFRYQDVADFLNDRGLPGHEWAGGNDF